MLYLLKITPMAFSDMQIGIKYYQLQRINLGKRFATVVDNALSNYHFPLLLHVMMLDIKP